MKRTLADLDLTNQQSAQPRSISVPHSQDFCRGKQQQRRNHVAWVCATIVRQTASSHCLLSRTNRNRTPNDNIINNNHTLHLFSPHKEHGCRMACSHREGSVQLLLFLAVSCPVYVSRSHIILTRSVPLSGRLQIQQNRFSGDTFLYKIPVDI